MNDVHDQMFKLLFSTPEAWQDLIINALPEKITRELSELIWRYVYEYVAEESRQVMLTELDRRDYTEEGGDMRSVADALRDEGRVEGRVEAHKHLLTRQMERRFGLADNERALIGSCDDADRLEAAADLVVDPGVEKQSILDHLAGNGSA